MPLRDIFLAALVLGSLPVCFARPYFGVLMWTWISLMNPHRLTWGAAYDMPFAQYVALATLLGLPFAKDRRPVPVTRETVTLAAFWALTLLSTVSALYPAASWPDFEQFSKILLMTFVTLLFVHTHQRLRLLVIVAATSVGFYGLKGGIWGLFVARGMHRVFGPAESFIADNNALALALNMTLPLLLWLAWTESRRWLRVLFLAAFGLSVLSVLLTYSRGGFLGLAAVLAVLMVRSRWKLVFASLTPVAAVGLASFLPERWFERMASIASYETDGSATSRLYAWHIGWNLALDNPFLGGGFRVFPEPEIWARYAPDWTRPVTYNAHSVYFQVLGEHGFVGLALFGALILFVLRSLRWVRRRAKHAPDAPWVVDCSRMIETSLIGFLVSGIFLNLAYFDLFYFLVAITVALKRLVTETSAAPVSLPAGPAVAGPPVRFVTRPGW